MTRPSGIVAAGHEITVNAANALLEDGGNAFDAALGGLFAACVAEPVLASLGGGGFLLAHRAARRLVNDLVVAAENRLLEKAKEQSFALAKLGERRLSVFLGPKVMDVELRITPGPKARLGSVRPPRG